MTNEQKIEALEFTIEVLQKKVERLKQAASSDSPPSEPCPDGQIRNAQGECVDDI